MRALITGATGFVGTALVERLKRNGDQLLCQSRKPHEHDQSNVRWIKHDLVQEPWDVLASDSLDVVYHLAGQTSTYAARADPIFDLESNVRPLLNLLERFRGWSQPPFVVLAGTATEVGLVDSLPITEAVPDRPITFYDLSKLTAERYLKQYVREGLARGCVLRFANVFGRRVPGQSEDRGILDKVYARAAAGLPITIYGDGAYLRDYVFIDDIVSALALAPLHPERTNGKTFNVGTGLGVTLAQAFAKIAALARTATGHDVAIEHVPPPAHLSQIEIRNAVFDCTAFRQATGWAPRYDFDSALREAYGG